MSLRGIAGKVKDFFFGKVVYSNGASSTSTIRILQKRNERILMFNGITFSRVVSGSIYTGGYWDYMLPLPSLYWDPHILLIGLGGGTTPFQLRSIYGKEISIDVVENDSEIIKASEAFIGKAIDFMLIKDNGESYVQSSRSKYSIILLDAYVNDNIPDVFFGEHFIADAHAALKDDGIMAINYILNAKGIRMLDAYVNILSKYFKVCITGSPMHSGNRLIICSKTFTIEMMASIASARFAGNKNMLAILKEYHCA